MNTGIFYPDTKLVDLGMQIIIVKNPFFLAPPGEFKSKVRGIFLSTRRQNRYAWKDFRLHSGEDEGKGEDTRKRELMREWRYVAYRARSFKVIHARVLRSASPSHYSSHDYEYGLTSFVAVLFIASRKRRNNDADPHHASSFHPRRESHSSRGGTLIWFISKICLPNRRTDHHLHMHRETSINSWISRTNTAFTRYEVGVYRKGMHCVFLKNIAQKIYENIKGRSSILTYFVFLDNIF